MSNLEFIICNTCSKKLEYQKISFRDSCPFCGVDLHTCTNCQFYSPGYYNDCLEPQAERVVQKDKANFCEFFRYTQKNKSDTKDQLKKLDELFKKQ